MTISAEMELGILTALAELIAGEDDLDAILAGALTQLQRAIPFTAAAIAVAEADADPPVRRAAVGAFAGPDAPQAYLAVPLLWRGRRLGVLELEAATPGAFTPAHVRLLQRLAPLLAGPLELARRQQAEASVRAESETAQGRLRDLIQDISAILWEAETENGRFTYVSQGVATVLGYAPEHWLAQPNFWESILHPDDRGQAIAGRRAAAATGGDCALEYRVCAADGRTVWLHDIIHAARATNGAALPLRGVMVDISGRKAVEAALQASDQFNKAVIASASEGVIVYDRELRYRVWNPFMERITGLPAAQVIGHHPTELFRNVQEQGVLALLERALTGETVSSPEWRYEVRTTGRAGWVMGSYGPQRDAAGAITGVIGIITDVGDRREAAEALRRSEERFRSLVEHAADAIAVYVPGQSITFVTPSAERLLGYAVESAEPGAAVQLVHPDDLPRWARLRDAALRHPEQSGVATLRLRHRDGSWRHIEITATNQVANASVSGIVLNMRDVTERKLVEAQLERRAYCDPLTGLPNRTFFNERLTHALTTATRGHTGVAVLFLDLDRFKSVNDSYGHGAGDELLIAVGQRLQSCLRASDTVARLGGDEFVILLEIIDMPADAVRAAERILDVMQAPFTVAERDLVITASIGVALNADVPSIQPDTLIQKADIALYRAKAAGRACYALFADGAGAATGQ